MLLYLRIVVKASKAQCVCVRILSLVWLFVTPWTAAHQAPLSMGFSRQEYWSGLSFPSPKDLNKCQAKYYKILE